MVSFSLRLSLSLSQVRTWLMKRKVPTMLLMQTRPSLTLRVASLGWMTRKSTSSRDPSLRSLFLHTLQFTQPDGGKQGWQRERKYVRKKKQNKCWPVRTEGPQISFDTQDREVRVTHWRVGSFSHIHTHTHTHTHTYTISPLSWHTWWDINNKKRQYDSDHTFLVSHDSFQMVQMYSGTCCTVICACMNFQDTRSAPKTIERHRLVTGTHANTHRT